jgi:hypothetical protein
VETNVMSALIEADSDAAAERSACAVTILRTIKHHCATKTWTLQTSGERKVQDYDSGMHFAPTEVTVASLDELHDLLDQLQHDPRAFIVRGALTPEVRETLARTPNRKFRRLKVAQGHDPALLVEVPRPWVMIDIDAFDLLPGESLVADPEGPIRRAIETLLPEPFQCADVVWQLSSSAGLRPGVLKLHAWFWLTRPVTGDELKRLLPRPIDPAPFDWIQIHYTASPIIKGGEDPLPRRLGMLRGAVRAVAIDEIVLPRHDNVSIGSGTWTGSESIDQILSKLGDGEGLLGFHEPLWRATLTYGRQSIETDQRDDAGFIAQLMAAIAAAPKDPSLDRDKYSAERMQRYITGAIRFWIQQGTVRILDFGPFFANLAAKRARAEAAARKPGPDLSWLARATARPTLHG